jgi:hypothetical protein
MLNGLRRAVQKSVFEILIIAAVLVFAQACRSFTRVAIRRVGSLAFVGVTFLAGYFASGGSLVWGGIAACFWILLPWIDLLTRIRPLRMPLDKKLNDRVPPNPDTFPHLRSFTAAVKEQGFVHIDDYGWDWDGIEQFVRFMYHKETRIQATINLSRQPHCAYAYMSVSSRTDDGKTWTTWNYPFSQSMKKSPDIEINRVRDARSFAHMVASHRYFLARNGVFDYDLREDDPEQLGALMERDMRSEINHNLDRGLLKLSGNGTFRYSWRGLICLWFQSLRDMVKLS